MGKTFNKIGKIVGGLSEMERHLAKNLINISGNLKDLINKTGISKQDFCLKFEIPTRSYRTFISGNYNYDLKDIAILHSWSMELSIKDLEEERKILKDKDVK